MSESKVKLSNDKTEELLEPLLKVVNDGFEKHITRLEKRISDQTEILRGQDELISEQQKVLKYLKSRIERFENVFFDAVIQGSSSEEKIKLMSGGMKTFYENDNIDSLETIRNMMQEMREVLEMKKA